MTTPSASRAAIAEAVAGAIAPAAEQFELLPPTRFEPGSQQHADFVERARRGRPLGARNVATRRAVELVRRIFGDPLIESARWLLHTPESLAAELDCSKLEAWDRLERVRADLRRFMYAPLAPVDGQGQAVAPVLNLEIGGRQAGAAGRPPWDYEGGPVLEHVAETEQNQSVSAPLEPVSNGAPSNGEAK
jgi:hypothetical protein